MSVSELQALAAEVEKWRGRARAGVTTPPPGYDAHFVPSKALREACEQRDAAESEVAALRERLGEVEAALAPFAAAYEEGIHGGVVRPVDRQSAYRRAWHASRSGAALGDKHDG